MEFLRADLGWQPAGTTLRVRLSAAANVRLLDAESAVFHQSDLAHVYYGILATRSPVLLTIPEDDHWFVVVDLAGLIGAVSADVTVLGRPKSRRALVPP